MKAYLLLVLVFWLYRLTTSNTYDSIEFYDLDNEAGVRLRIKLVDDLRKICKRCPLKIKKAAEELAKSCMSNKISDYIEAFYPLQPETDPLPFMNFITYEGNGSFSDPTWKAALDLQSYLRIHPPNWYKINRRVLSDDNIDVEGVVNAFNRGADIDYVKLFHEGSSYYSKLIKPTQGHSL